MSQSIAPNNIPHPKTPSMRWPFGTLGEDIGLEVQWGHKRSHSATDR
jgi:hypothetical protein